MHYINLARISWPFRDHLFNLHAFTGRPRLVGYSPKPSVHKACVNYILVIIKYFEDSTQYSKTLYARCF